MDSATRRASVLLERLRQTPMRRGAISKQRKPLKNRIASTVEAHGIPRALAQRIAFQLIFKFSDGELHDRDVWTEIGRLLQQEVSRLKSDLRLAERQIIAVLPKLSARQVEEFFEELQKTDRTIARTILNAALDAANPLATGRRYLAQYLDVVSQLQILDPRVARTLANATFTACSPHGKATEFLERLAVLMGRFETEVDFARRLSKATFRAPDPVKAAEAFISDYKAVREQLVSRGVSANTARTIASISRCRRGSRNTGGAPHQ